LLHLSRIRPIRAESFIFHEKCGQLRAILQFYGAGRFEPALEKKLFPSGGLARSLAGLNHIEYF
jgi:hypothetical protein